jgi:hypothetical protein
MILLISVSSEVSFYCCSVVLAFEQVGVLGSSFSLVIGLATGFLDAAWSLPFGVLRFFAGILRVMAEPSNTAYSSSSFCVRPPHVLSSSVGIGFFF